MLHWVSHETGHQVGDMQVIAIYWPHQKVITYIVRYREVPPYISRTLDEVVDPFHTTLFGIAFIHVGNYTVACPHDVDAWI